MSSDLVSLTYIGGPTLLIECAGLRILTDPTFDEPGREYPGPVQLHKQTGPACTITELGPMDIVLLSHDHHMDNLDQSGRASLTNARTVLTTMEGSKRLGDNSMGLEPGESWTVPTRTGPQLTVTATPAQHGPAGADRGPVIGFVLELSQPRYSIYVTGDTVLFPGVFETLQRHQPLNMAVLFMGAARVPVLPSHLTLTASEGVEIARALPEAALIPVHFEGWQHFTEGREAIEKAFREAGLGDRLSFLQPGRPQSFA